MIFNILIVLKIIANFVNNMLVRYPVPKNLGYMWNYGSLSGIFLVLQLVTGIFLAMFYTPHVDFAFTSVDNIMHNVMFGWIIRLVHLNSASFFFLFIYIHMLRGIYYKSYQLTTPLCTVQYCSLRQLLQCTRADTCVLCSLGNGRYHF